MLWFLQVIEGLGQLLNTPSSCFEGSVQYSMPEDALLEGILAQMQSLLAAWGEYDR